MNNPLVQRYIARKLEKDLKLRTFQQMHQDDVTEVRRAGGGVLCDLCGLEYREHPFLHNDPEGGVTRLCDGDLVHL